MEGTHISSSTDLENNSDPFEHAEKERNSTKINAERQRQIAREALRFEDDEDDEESRTSKRRAVEAHQIHGGLDAEHIGHVLVSAQANEQVRQSTAHESVAERVKLPADKRIETLSRAELLELCGQIQIEGTSLRQIYETHLIGENGLRRLVSEYLHGGNMQKALHREVVEHEIDFERDPALRDMSTTDDDLENGNAIAPDRESLDELLKKAEAILPQSDDDLNYHKAPAESPAAHASSSTNHSLPLDRIMAVTIIVLLILVVVLFIWRF
jgi:hypothetical protein